MDINHISKELNNIAGSGNVKIHEPLKHHTSFNVGGPADILVTPQSSEALQAVVKLCSSSKVPVFVMGNGTNLVVRDGGIRGVVVKLFDNLSSYKVTEDLIEAEAGILLSKLSKIALQHELSGLEFAEGIPGTLGGAVVMNAGAYTGVMKDVVIKTEYMDRFGEIHQVSGEEHCFGYRTSFLQRERMVVLRSQLKLKKGVKSEIEEKMKDFNWRRRDKQPLELPSAGSVFKRPEGFFAGKLIEDCGLRGHRIGGAEVSAKHCGFIVNAGDAAAADVIELIKHIQDTVRNRFGVELHTEVRIVGED